MSYAHILKEDDNSVAAPIDLKHENRYRVLQAFRFGYESTVADVSAATRISKLTVMRAVQFFCQKGILRSAGLGQSSDVGGKKPEVFAFADDRRVLCVALWPGQISLCAALLTGKPIAGKTYPLALHLPLREVFAALKGHLADFMKQNELEADTLYGVTLSTFGTVDYESGCLHYSSHSPEWGRDIPLKAYMRELVGEKPVILVENAGKTIGRSVLFSRPELDACRVLTFFTCMGISACLLQNGKPLSGGSSLIGEIGHMTIEPTDGELCGCGMRGCLERLVSLGRVHGMLRDNPPPMESPLAGDADTVDFLRIFKASEGGDAYARSLVRYLAECFASALHNIRLVYNPDCVVFQGDFGHADAYFDERLHAALSVFQYHPQERAFETVYDNRELIELDAQGGWFMLNDQYFGTVAHYQDEENSPKNAPAAKA